ncbi:MULTISPECIES: thiosulfate oxidation carrier complex protein SoxZ [Ectothiorhodospira]|jgi:sulfur-oxidizing protein SoxZ|uniref:Sulfur-oxidizing protein SoxZ n=1 Tax=Ectothiorhodospira marina TaxID=1396821 RepID=A0A1H7HR40_9GAMM|nr:MULTISPECIES: thiosulfate oxidation carrier complex protein SoxZ [Ectothiorhodospira]MCG5515859.1 thiosulfate oxidation carrier complex protein SoxZ [Ectothiorhodospira sp. 9100]MCG5518801.1 thiosulfate oxidation carrier complex protein SoxZ [Ectothiorhodospira sp. 9905]SEK52147.1 sulfur-oxidizing protein SoxZ [Ectothiorhodospira marina]
MSSIRVRAQLSDGVTNVRALISHPMETGQRTDSGGNTIPAHYITEVKAKVRDREILTANWGPSISRNPYLSFQFEGASSGDTLELSWVDNNGDSDSTQVQIR